MEANARTRLRPSGCPQQWRGIALGPSDLGARKLGHLARSSTPRRSPRRSARRRQSNPEGEVQKEEVVVLDAVVTQALPNAMFEVELENSHRLIAYAAGRMRRYRIRITPGDQVRVELSPYDLNRGRVVYRYRDGAGR